MIKELIERLRRIAVLEAESAGFSKEDAAEWEAADAIESLQAENERAKSAIKTLEYLGYTNHGGEFWKPSLAKAPDFDFIDSIRSERDALAAKLAILTEARACEIFTMGEWCLWPLDRYEEAKERGWQVRKLVIEPALPIKTQLDAALTQSQAARVSDASPKLGGV